MLCLDIGLFWKNGNTVGVNSKYSTTNSTVGGHLFSTSLSITHNHVEDVCIILSISCLVSILFVIAVLVVLCLKLRKLLNKQPCSRSEIRSLRCSSNNYASVEGQHDNDTESTRAAKTFPSVRIYPLHSRKNTTNVNVDNSLQAEEISLQELRHSAISNQYPVDGNFHNRPVDTSSVPNETDNSNDSLSLLVNIGSPSTTLDQPHSYLQTNSPYHPQYNTPTSDLDSDPPTSYRNLPNCQEKTYRSLKVKKKTNLRKSRRRFKSGQRTNLNWRKTHQPSSQKFYHHQIQNSSESSDLFTYSPTARQHAASSPASLGLARRNVSRVQTASGDTWVTAHSHYNRNSSMEWDNYHPTFLSALPVRSWWRDSASRPQLRHTEHWV